MDNVRPRLSNVIVIPIVASASDALTDNVKLRHQNAAEMWTVVQVKFVKMVNVRWDVGGIISARSVSFVTMTNVGTFPSVETPVN